MATNTVTTEQVREAIEQLAAMVAAASISPQTVANILEMLRNLNDQERLKVIEVAEEKMNEILNVDVPKVVNAEASPLCLADYEGNVIADFPDGDFRTKNFNSANIKVEKINGKNVLYLGK